MLEIARFFAWVLCPWHTLYDIPMAMMPCSYVPTTRKEGAITNLKEKATVPGNYEHQTLLANTSNCQIHFFYFQNRLQCFFMWYNMVRSVFFFVFFLQRKLYCKSVVTDFKLRILQMVQLQGRRSRLCVFVIYASWLAFREASIIHRMHVLYFCSEKVVLIKNVILCRVCTVNAVTWSLGAYSSSTNV